MTDAGEQTGVRPRPLLVACVIIGVEALGLLVGSGVLVAKAVGENHGSLARVLLGAAFGVGAAVVLLLCARALLRLRPAARTPVVVLELLTMPVGYTVAFDNGDVGYGAPILIAAIAVVYLLFTPPVRAVLDREPPG